MPSCEQRETTSVTESAEAVSYTAPEVKTIDQPIDTTNYLQDMIDACASNDAVTGKNLETKRNQKIDNAGISTSKVSYSDLYSLSMVIHNEAGSNWLSMEWKMKTGEVLLNRVASPEFPNTIDDCINGPGAYDIRYKGLPSIESATAAARLLSGERIIDDTSVVYQANFKQGSGIYEVMHDDILGDTYLCYSSHPELYE